MSACKLSSASADSGQVGWGFLSSKFDSLRLYVSIINTKSSCEVVGHLQGFLFTILIHAIIDVCLFLSMIPAIRDLKFKKAPPLFLL